VVGDISLWKYGLKNVRSRISKQGGEKEVKEHGASERDIDTIRASRFFQENLFVLAVSRSKGCFSRD
jgi:hypothetical protein